MIGTFSPQAEPYTHEMPEETTPSGIFARGSYAAKTKVSSTSFPCFLALRYSIFDIRYFHATDMWVQNMFNLAPFLNDIPVKFEMLRAP